MKIVVASLAIVVCGALSAPAVTPLDKNVFKCEDKTATGLVGWGAARGKCLVKCAQKKLKDPTRLCLAGTCSTGHCTTDTSKSCSTSADCALDALTTECTDKAATKVSEKVVDACPDPPGLPDCGGYVPSCNTSGPNINKCSNDVTHSCSVDSDCPQSTPADYVADQVASQAGLIDPATDFFMCALKAGTCNTSGPNVNKCSNDTTRSCTPATQATDCPPNNVKDKCGPAVISNLSKLTVGLAKCFGKCDGKALVKLDPTRACVPDKATSCSTNGDCATNGACVSGKCDPLAPLDVTTRDCILAVEGKATDGINAKCAPAPPCLGGATFSAASAIPFVTGALLPAYADPARTQYCAP